MSVWEAAITVGVASNSSVASSALRVKRRARKNMETPAITGKMMKPRCSGSSLSLPVTRMIADM